MARTRTPPFNPHTVLSEVGRGKTSLPSPNKHTIFSQGDAADAVFYIQAGKVKLTVVSRQGKEAIVAILEQGAFFGEACLAGQTLRTATATTAENSRLVRIDKEAMIQVLREKPAFAELLWPICSRTRFVSKRIWWISSLTPARSGSRGYYCCWPISAKKANRSR